MVLALAVVFASAPARAWDDLGHMEVAALAFAKLTPKARQRAAALLKLNPRHASWVAGAAKADEDRVAFMRASTWADSIKSDANYTEEQRRSPTAAQALGYADHLRHKSWHYINRPFSPDATPVVPPETPNIGTQIPVLRAALAGNDTSDDAKSYALVWLLHLVGDVHQPLHCVARFDRAQPRGDAGGNAVEIMGNSQPSPCDDPRYCPFGPPKNLHFFWDDLEGASYATQTALAASARLPKPDPKKAAISDEKVWIDEGFELARTVVYAPPIGVGAGPFTVDEKYEATAHKVARERMALAAARLANLVNDALDR
jgi:hypothetical protein